MVRGDLAGHGQTLGLCGLDHLEALGRGDVADVQGAARHAAELDVAIDLELLAEGRPAKHTQARRGATGVDDAVLGAALDLAVRTDDTVELADVAHAGLHHASALHAMAVVGERGGALHHHVTDLGE